MKSPPFPPSVSPQHRALLDSEKTHEMAPIKADAGRGLPFDKTEHGAATPGAPAAASAGPPAVAPERPGVRAGAQAAATAHRIGRYVILRTLGQGGMGVVYAAYDEELDRRVALKVLHSAASSSQELRQRMLREAQALARISDPHVIHVYEVGEISGQVFLAMEFVNGTTLEGWQKAMPRSWQETLRMYIKAGRGLQAAHAAGLVHRDFKPENVLIGDEGRPRVADFGLARLEGSLLFDEGAPTMPPVPASDISPTPLQASLTQAGSIMGTPLFMSPEQHQGLLTDARSDQFSFCVALFEALYNQLPFRGATLAAVRYKIFTDDVERPPESSPVPPSVLATLLRGLASAPGNRFPSMSDLLTALSTALAKEAEDPTVAPRSRRHFVIGTGAFLVIATVGLRVLRAYGAAKLSSSLLISTLFLCVVLSLAVYTRRTLLTNLFHRGLISVGAALCAQFVLVRALAFLLDIPFSLIMTLDLLALGICSGLLGAMFLPWVGALAPLALLGSFAAALYPSHAQRISSILTPALVGATLLLWNRAAKRRRVERASQAGAS